MTIFYNLDMNTWRTTFLSEFVGVISKGIMDRLFRLYYEYEHLSRQIDMQLHMRYNADNKSLEYKLEKKALVNAIQAHLPPWKKESRKLSKDIDDEIKRLS